MGASASGGYDADRTPAAFRTLYTPGHRVELAATPMGPKLPNLQAYHTSIVVDGKEYAFDNIGVMISDTSSRHPGPSHEQLGGPGEVLYQGLTSLSGDEMYKALYRHFKPGSYDLLRKNCNSFSDCALFYLVDVRLDKKYRTLEQVGAAADNRAKVVRRISGGEYAPNRKADGFDLEKIVRKIGEERKEAENKSARAF